MRSTRIVERRRCPRFAVAMRGILVTEGARFELQVNNLSMHGAFATPRTPATLLPGAFARLVMIGGSGQRCELGATVTAYRGAYSLGLIWRGDTASAQKLLRRLLWADLGGDVRQCAAHTAAARNIHYLAPARQAGPLARSEYRD